MTPQLLLAPFRGITPRAYRNAMARHFGGYDEMYAPFISGVGTQRINPSKLTDVVPLQENLAPTVPQFISTDAREIILLGHTLQQHGYDHINWNLGCPFSRIANKKRGCGLLPYPGELQAILDEVFRAFPINLSVKTRLGYRHPDEIFPIMEVLNQYPIHLLIVHARIGTQVYSGQVNLEGFAACVEASRHKVAYNGDIWHATRYHELQQRFPGVDTWMPGRGALINPFLAQQIRGHHPDDATRRTLMALFHRELLEAALSTAKNEARLLGSMKAIWYYLAGSFSQAPQVFAPIKQSRTLKDYLAAVEQALQQPFASERELEEYFTRGIRHVGGLAD